MSLDMDKVVLQIGDMVSRLRGLIQEKQKNLELAFSIIDGPAADITRLMKKIAASKTTWLVAGLVEPINRCYPAPLLPPDYTAVATDGSHIDVDRHQSTRCYLINIGSVTLRYGTDPGAVLDNRPSLYFGDDDLFITAAGGGRRQPVEGALLGVKRAVAECRQLVSLSDGLPPGSQSLALLDGSLILWGLAGQAYPDFVTEALLKDGFLHHLDELERQNQDKQLALASYISLPRSADVVNALRLAICPHPAADCDHLCPGQRDCDTVAGLQDRELFAELLHPGERSALFYSQSSVVDKHYGRHRVYFFYLKVDDEIARVEVPQWVATDGDLLDLTHSLVIDQCRRGHGYPVALSEAHEKAVVTGADREQFWQLVESLLVEEHLPTLTSAKNRSKRTRWI